MADNTYVGINPENPDSLTDGGEKPQYGEDFTAGELMTEANEEKVAKAVNKQWTDQDRIHARYLAECRINELRRGGEVNVKIVTDMDRADGIQVVRTGTSLPSSNKAATLCRKLRSMIFVDPPMPDCQPSSGDEDDGDAAEQSTRVLLDSQDERLDAAITAFDKGSTYGSGHVWQYVDPRGERAPITVQAHPEAVHVDAPFTGPPSMMPHPFQPDQMVEGPGAPLDPAEATDRFVTPDGTLSDNEGEAAQQWMPKHCREPVSGPMVRFLPATARSRFEAQGAMIAGFVPWAKIKHQFPELDKLPVDEKKKLWGWCPEKSRHLAPGNTTAEREAALQLKDDDALCWTIKAYHASTGDYPDGYYLVVVGEKHLAHRQTWMAEVNGVQEPLEIPLSQYKQWSEGQDHPQGVAMMTLIGNGNERAAAFLGTMLEHLDRLNRQKGFIPTNSLITPAEMANTEQRWHRINPGGEPKYEEIPPFDRNLLDFADRESADMDRDSGLSETAQNLDTGNVNSGRQAYAVMAQAHTQLSELQQNVMRAFVLDCRIELQLKRAFYTKPQLLKYGSKETGYKEKRWVGSDLGSTRDVKVKAGTMTLMSPLTKADVAMQWSVPTAPGAQPLLDAAQVRQIMESNVGALIGLQDEPHRVRIRRQIADWEDGPPPTWQPLPPIPQVVGVDATGQPAVQQVPQPDPVLGPMWEPLIVDELQPVATIRLEELGKCMASVKYSRFPPEWRAPVDAEFQRARQFAGVATIPEQQQAQADAAAQAQADEQAKGDQAHQQGLEKDAQREQMKAQTAAAGQPT